MPDEPEPPQPDRPSPDAETLRDSDATLDAQSPDAEPYAAGEQELIADRYRIVRRLGAGGMAAVFLADDTQGGDQVALKIPHLVADNEALLKRFQREGRAVAAIDHPNVCGFREIAEHRGRLFMTMDYIAGGTLAEWIQEHPEVTADEAVAIVVKIARGMQAAHAASVVHRDLKAGNIMMTEAGKPIVTDFGMVSWTDAQETVLTPTGAMVGTPGYMAPEQITCDKDRIGPATDVYGMGVILYELLTGWMPFSGNLATLLGSVVSDPPPPPTKHTADLDPGLEAIVLRALAKAPEDRYASAAELAEALEAHRRGDSPSPAGGAAAANPDGSNSGSGGRGGLLGKLFGAVRRGGS